MDEKVGNLSEPDRRRFYSLSDPYPNEEPCMRKVRLQLVKIINFASWCDRYKDILPHCAIAIRFIATMALARSGFRHKVHAILEPAKPSSTSHVGSQVMEVVWVTTEFEKTQFKSPLLWW